MFMLQSIGMPVASRNKTRKKGSDEFALNTWIDQECRECKFADVRLEKRFRKLVEQVSDGVGNSIPLACQDWANTKAAYRFFSNERISEGEILGGHFQATRKRFDSAPGPILVLHDTSEFVYRRPDDSPIGIIRRPAFAKSKIDPERYTVRGILMHSSLAVTQKGIPLGLAAIKFWTRSQFKGCNALKRKINPTRIPIEEKESFRWIENLRQSSALLGEPERCVHIGDRESDIYELFSTAQALDTRFLVRTCVDRLAGNGEHTINAEMSAAKVKGTHRIEVRTKRSAVSTAILDVKYQKIQILPPIGKSKEYSALTLTVIHARERGTPEDREGIEWKLITNLPIDSLGAAIEKLNWYAMRWKIETFHKILKSGCKAEESKLRTSERLARFVAVLCIVGWRVFWLTMSNRATPDALASNALTPLECKILDQLVHENAASGQPNRTIAFYLKKLARLGGYLARKKDPPPGNMVMWRGMSRLTDIQLGFLLGAKLVGN